MEQREDVRCLLSQTEKILGAIVLPQLGAHPGRARGLALPAEADVLQSCSLFMAGISVGLVCGGSLWGGQPRVQFFQSL